MKQTTWPGRSDGRRFTAFPLWNTKCKKHHKLHPTKHSNQMPGRRTSSSSSTDGRDFSALPYELIMIIGVSLSHPNLRAASLACKSWYEALEPLLYMRWGKRFKHGRGGVQPNMDKAHCSCP